LVKGNIIYYGPPRGISAYFGNIGFQMPLLSNPADFIMRIVNDNDIRISHEARIMKKKKAMLEENYEKLIVRASEGNFSQSSVKSESRKLAKAQFLEMEKSDAKMKKITEEDVKD
jgi:hypothetical protein